MVSATLIAGLVSGCALTEESGSDRTLHADVLEAADRPAPPFVGLPQASASADPDTRLLEGLERRVIAVDGRPREFFVHRPVAVTGNAAVLFQLHGGTGTAPRRAAQTGFNQISDREGFIVVYPQGVGNGWNDGRATDYLLDRQEGVNDVAFFAAMFDALIASGEADPKRIYMSGGSNGGMMTYRLACELGDRIAASTAMVASLPEKLAPTCRPQRPMPLLIMAGTADPLMPFGGGVVSMQEQHGRVIPMKDTVEFWRNANGCAGAPRELQIPDRDPGDGMRTDVFAWTDCKGGSELVFYRMNGAGHGLPGRSRAKSETAERLGGKSSNDFDSSEETWAFVKRFSLP